MSDYRQSGFTVIEVVLFLAISSALAIAIIAGSSMSINQARYRDSIASLQSELQDGLRAATLTYNTNNRYSCNSAAGLQSANGNDVHPGTSKECVVLGRILITSPGGDVITSKPVVGYGTTGEGEISSDLAAIRQYAGLQVVDGYDDVYQIPWDATLAATVQNPVSPGASRAANGVYILLLRSPITNTIVSFIGENESDSLPGSLTDIVVNDATESPRRNSVKICLQASDFFVGENRGVFIRQGASVAGDVIEIGSGADDREGITATC